ncbi:cytochrome c [Undibacterium sp.]|uniref:cytochrome c n=1 Tax=Undibacterium sp. TaxID=1914977 RepID=UPI003751A541
MLFRLLLSLVGLLLVLTLGVVGFYWRFALAAVAPPPASAFSVQLVQKGQVLAGMGNCAACHTTKGGASYAGGLPMATPFGVIYSSNITPDPDTGIGRWSQDAFKRAMREGVRQDGAHLFPAFPYTHFTIINDEDLSALYAFLMTRPAVHALTPVNTIPFPLNIRSLQAGWKFLYFDKKPYQTNVAQSVDWNRGRYLAEGIAHCAACHTPRNFLGAEKKYSAYLGAQIDGWFAPALTAANTSPLPWTEAELFAYLRSGVSQFHGVASGPMSEVVHQGLALSPDADIHALATYFININGGPVTITSTASADAIVVTTLAKIMGKSAQVSGFYTDRGANLYLAACASCHSNSNGIPTGVRPELGLNSALTATDPGNLLRVIFSGAARRTGGTVDAGLGGIAIAPGSYMPGFAASLTNDDLVQLASYLRRSRTDLPPWDGLEASVVAARKASTP